MLEGGGGEEGEEDGAPRRRIVARLVAGDGGVFGDDNVLLVVVQDGVFVGEDEEVVVWEEVDVGVQVIVLGVVRLQAKQKIENERTASERFWNIGLT